MSDPQHDLSLPPAEQVLAEVQMIVDHVGPFDLIAGKVNVKLEVIVNWKDPRIQSVLEAGRPDVWRPKLNIFNRTSSMNRTETKMFFRDGICGLNMIMEGPITVAVGDGLKTFPFDNLHVEIIVDAKDDYMHEGVLDLRIAPQESIHRECFGPQKGGQKAVKFETNYNPIATSSEWLLCGMQVKEVTATWTRRYKRLSLNLDFARQPFYYVIKIVLVLLMLNLLCLTAFVINPLDGLPDRLSFIATMFLATTAFLFVISSDLPRTTYLNQLDKLIFLSFTVQFLCGLVSTAQGVALRVDRSYESYVARADAFCVAACTLVLLWPFLTFWIPSYITATRAIANKHGVTKSDLQVACPLGATFGNTASSSRRLDDRRKARPLDV
jgi:hypothetical protein